MQSTERQGVMMGVVGLAIIAVLAGAGYYLLSSGPAHKPLPVDMDYRAPRSLAVSYVEKGSQHIFSGAIPVPSSCSKVAQGVAVAEERGRYKATVSIGILTEEQSSGCVPLAAGATQTFTASFFAEHDLPVDLAGVRINGKDVEFVVE